MDPDQTAPIGAVGSGSTLFASIIKLVSIIRQLYAVDDFSRRHLSDAFFLGALRVKIGFREHSGSVVTENRLQIEGLLVQDSPKVLYCVLEQDTLSSEGTEGTVLSLNKTPYPQLSTG